MMSKNTLSSCCEITTFDNITLAKGNISDITEKYIEIADPYDRMPAIEENMLVKLIIHNINNDTYVCKIYLSNDRCLRLTGLKEYSDFEKRRYYRINLSIKTSVYIHTGIDSKPFNTKDVFNIEIINLSIMGALFNSSKMFEENQKLGIVLPIRDSEPYICKVIRRTEDNNNFYYGCEFLNITNKQENVLSNFIFQEQRRIIQEWKQNKF